MDKLEFTTTPRRLLWRGEVEQFIEDELVMDPADPKQLRREAAALLSRDRVQPNIGRVQQFEKECYRSFFFEFVQGSFPAWLKASASHPSASIVFASVTADQVADILVSFDYNFWIQVEAKLHTKGVPSEVTNRLSSFLETLPSRTERLASQTENSPLHLETELTQSATDASRESFVSRARRLETSGNIDEALDLVYDSVDQMLRTSRFDQLNELLNNLRVEDYSTDILLALLTSTFPAKTKLPSQALLFESTKRVLRQRSEDVDSLLVGLEG